MEKALELMERPSTIVFGGVQSSSLDVVAVETFTLEEFRMLVALCISDGRDFVVARVATQDQSTRLVFHSYYAAAELNRILFCSENSRVLYRMRPRNPDNNLAIMGEVSYYKITSEALQLAAESGSAEIRAEYVASDEDLLFDASARRYFARHAQSELLPEIEEEDKHHDKLSLKIILYTNIGTVLTVLGMCLFLGSSDILLSALAPLALTLFFSLFFLALYAILFEDSLASIFARKTQAAN